MRNTLIKSYVKSDPKITLNFEKTIKEILEKAFIVHKLKDNKIIFSLKMSFIYKTLFNLENKKQIEIEKDDDVFTYFYKVSSLKIKNKAPYYVGSRMGRPEKSERKSMKGVHALFPLSNVVGSSRLLDRAMDYSARKTNENKTDSKKKKSIDFSSKNTIVETGKVKIDVCRKKCLKCGRSSFFNICHSCGTHTELQKICLRCKTLHPTFED